MNSFIDIMAAPFVECLVLVGIHAYLGLHVIRRRVIFVDLSLAQIAALGTSVGILFGIYDTESTASFVFSLAFAYIGAAVFALTRIKDDRVPQEAVIGLVYAITAAVAVLVVQKTKGVEHLVNITHGRLLWVKWAEIAEAAVGYSIIGVIHFVFRKPFWRISREPERAYAEGMPVKLWDFFFYLTFGTVISISVKVAGVLLVFVFLVAPAILAFLITDDIRKQLLIGWISGTLVTTVGLSLSWLYDLPSGPTVVAFYGVVLLLAGVINYLWRTTPRLVALRNLAVGTAIAGALGAGIYEGGKVLADATLHAEEEHHDHAHGQIRTASAPGHRPSLHERGATGPGTEASPEPGLEPSAEASGGEEPALTGTAALIDKYRCCDTCLDRVTLFEQMIEESRLLALDLLYVFMMDGDTSMFCRTQALDLIEAETGRDFGIDPEKDPVDNREALESYRQWVQEQ